MSCPPVLFLIFNRPIVTQQVFERICEARPAQLFIAADGPRPSRPDDIALCNAARSIIEKVDWPCDVKTLLRDENLGCDLAVNSAITWFFDQVDYGIILEDDCLPTLDFFEFCGELLERYQYDSRIGMISGNNWGWNLCDESASYSFSRHGLIWGWASWRRAWERCGLLPHQMTACERNLIKANISMKRFFAETWWGEATDAMQKHLYSWDYLWGIGRYANNLLTIRPKVNLVANIGFGQQATRTTGKANSQYTITDELYFPLTHPRVVLPDHVADTMLENFIVASNRHRGAVGKFRKWMKLKTSRILGQH